MLRQDRDVCLGEENVEQDKGAIKHEENPGVEVHPIWLLLNPCSGDIIPCEWQTGVRVGISTYSDHGFDDPNFCSLLMLSIHLTDGFDKR